MTPPGCARHKPEDIALDAYAGLLDDSGERVFGTTTCSTRLRGHRQRQAQGHGLVARDRAPVREWSGIRRDRALRFAPIHERNNLNLGQLMGG